MDPLGPQTVIMDPPGPQIVTMAPIVLDMTDNDTADERDLVRDEDDEVIADYSAGPDSDRYAHTTKNT